MSSTQIVSSAESRHWVLLRGLSRDSRHWEELPQELQQSFPKDKVTCLDLAGTGSRHRQPSCARIETMVDDLRHYYSQRLATSPKQRLTLLSISMGGMIAADWCSRYPDEIESAVIINSSSRLNPWWQRMRPAAMVSLLLSLCLGARKREKIIVHYTSNRFEKREQVAARWLDYHNQAPARVGTILKQLFAATRFTPPTTLSTDVLVIKSCQDRLVNQRCSDVLAALWKAPLLQQPDAGHDLPLDNAVWLIEQLQQWVGEKLDDPSTSREKLQRTT